ncbi:hypothetical protein EOI86_07185 [Hwanghaeella grinnelliae]|uniref:Periplasmic binding protein domain-containing protein n=1 Tax=Hwanghaeella grinnelliae TaxID=2500179 RepID=A0A437QX74_9PROT|nr:hypothetical protein [Hwanghaeella grinnelliae]RVU39033.1 hypothetical protein EOI86_07185 [Hwanghaeella grinnelliae]
MSFPTTLKSPFWGPYAEIAERAARDLNIHLKISASTGNNRSDFMARLRDDLTGKTLPGNEPPDYLLVFPYFGVVPEVMELSERLGVRVVTLNSAVGSHDRETVGQPRGRYKNWILQSFADDEQAGYELAAALERAARQRFGLGDSGVVKMNAVGGNHVAGSSLLRRDGLERFILSTGDHVALNQFVFTDWTYKRGREVNKGMLRRYARTHAIWTVSPNLGRAAADEIDASARTGPRPVVGLFDGAFSKSALEGLENGRYSAVAGGHFIEGGILLTLVLDHFNGFDFADDIGTELKTPFLVAGPENREEIQKFMNRWVGDGNKYRRFSKCFNRDLKKYHFDRRMMLDQ